MTATAHATEWVRGIGLECKGFDDGALTFRGLAAAWSKDHGNDVIHKGAFARTLDHFGRAKGRIIPLLDAHPQMYGPVTMDRILGKVTDAVEVDDGLDTGFQLVQDDPAGLSAYRRVKGGFVTGLSIGYQPVRWEMEGKVRHLLEVKLLEVSLVMWPMNEDAQIDAASVKSILAKASLSDADREELTALLAPKAPAPATPEPALFDPLRAKLLQLQLHRLATRASGPARVGV